MRCRGIDKNCKTNRGFAGKVGVPMRGGGGNCAGFQFCVVDIQKKLAFCLSLI